MNKLKPIFLLKIAIAILIAYQSYRVYTLEKQLDHLDKTGQLKCSKP